MMVWLLALVAVAVLGVAAVAATGRLGELSPVVDDRVAPALPPSGRLTAEQLRGVEFAVVPRGYSMSQVDQLLDRVATQVAADDERNRPPEASDRPLPG